MTTLKRRTVRSACGLLLLFGWLAPTASAEAATHANRWTKQAPIPTWYSPQGIAALSPDEAWVASAPLLGDVGQLAHTTDAGTTWRVVDMPHQVNAVAFTDRLHGWAAGNAFWHTTDAGRTWTQDNDFGSIYDLFFLDSKHGWACGNGSVTYYTTNGGLTWTPVGAPGGSTMGSIWFSDRHNGWALNIEGQVFRSTNGGRSWTLRADLDGTNLQMIQFFDLKHGWVIGGEDFYHTTNGGRTWARATIPPGTWAYGGRFFDRLHGVAVGETGNVLRTEDGGRTWKTIASQGSGQRLWDVEYAGPETLFLAGDSGVISRSIDGGVTWNSIQSGGAGATHGFDGMDGQTAWAGQDGGEIVYTVDGGAQWVRSSVQGFDAFGHVMAVAFADRSRGWAAGGNDEFTGSRGVISRSDDGGRTWLEQVRIPDVTFKGMEALDRRTAVAVGSSEFVGGLVIRTTDGGTTWQEVTAAAEGFRDVFFIDTSTGWLVGSSIYKTIDGGVHWTRQYGTDATELDAVSFSDPLHGWATGYNNLVLRTANGGRSWVAQDVGAPPVTAITGVTAIDTNTAWIAGWYGFVAKTTDRGRSWRPKHISGAEQVDFEDALFVDAHEGWVGGNIGIWKHT